VGRCALALVVTAAAPVVGASDLQDILTRFDEVQESIRTLSARFRETTENPLLKQPVSATGRFYMTKPHSIRWEYDQPEEMRFVISDDEYTGYFPLRKTAEKRNIRRWSERIFRFIGLGQTTEELEKFYTIRLGEAEERIDGTHLLVFEPRKKRVRKRVDEVHFWVDRSTLLPVRVEYRGNDGNTRVIEFQEIRLNPDLAAGLYVVEIPPGVTVSRGFSGLPAFDSDDDHGSASN
jgi:outer membrane lipoprotein-sorting protein